MRQRIIKIVAFCILVAFFISQLVCYVEKGKTASIYAINTIFIMCMMIYIIYAILLIMNIGNKWKIIEKILIGINAICIIMICFVSWGIVAIPGIIINFLAIVSAFLGIVGLWQNKNKLDEAFIVWAIFLYVWVNNLNALLLL